MAEARIPVDLFNPGQVFACLGFLEAAHALLGRAEGGFDCSGDDRTHFILSTKDRENPVGAVLAFLAGASVSSVASAGSSNTTQKWNVPTELLDEDASFPFPDPRSPATLPALLRGSDGKQLVIDHWGDSTDRDNMKFWAGSGGYPGAALVRDALDLVRNAPASAVTDPFSVRAQQSSSLRFDWRRDYIPMDVGFSPNEHAQMTMLGYPFVEILAAIGLTNARPKRLEKLEYRYGVIQPTPDSRLVSPLLARAALGCAPLPFDLRTFRMRLGWPGQENQARCITNVFEEPQQ